MSQPICLMLPLATDRGTALFGRTDHVIPSGSLIAVGIATDGRPWVCVVNEDVDQDRAMQSLRIDAGPAMASWIEKTPKDVIDTSNILSIAPFCNNLH